VDPRSCCGKVTRRCATSREREAARPREGDDGRPMDALRLFPVRSSLLL